MLTISEEKEQKIGGTLPVKRKRKRIKCESKVKDVEEKHLQCRKGK